jgi:hypothetical protein
MSTAWVAGSVRARALARRRIGAAGTRRLAAAPTAAEAIRILAGTPYGHDVRAEHSLAEADRAIGATALWHLRVLAGWLPAGGVPALRVLAGWFEIANIDELVRRITGAPSLAPYRLGALATAWPRLEPVTSLAALREALAASPWGDPGAAEPHAIGLWLRVGWAGRVAGQVPDARPWAAGGLALLVAREAFAAGRPLRAPLAERAAALVGRDAVGAASYREFTDRLASGARWALADIDDAGELWRAEARWWTRVERDGFALLGRARFDGRAAVGAVAVLAADAWRARAALANAARGGSLAVLDAMA